MIKKLLASALLAATLATPAQALMLEGADLLGGSQVTDYSGAGLLAFDLDLHAKAPTTLRFIVEEADLLGPVEMNAVIRNFSGSGLDFLSLAFSHGGVADMGSVTRAFGGATAVSAGSGWVRLDFSPAEYLDLELGDAYGSTPGARNWVLDSSAWRVGDRLALTLAVPEPGSLALFGAALGLLALTRRSGRR